MFASHQLAQLTLPSVSVPRLNAHIFVTTATALPQLDPPGCSARLYGFRHWPPRDEYPSELLTVNEVHGGLWEMEE